MNIVRVYNEKASLRAFLEIILTLSTTTIFALFALKPTILTIISLTNEIKQKKETVVQLDQKIRDLALASNVKAQNQSKLDDIDVAVNTVPKPHVLAKQMLGLSAKDSVELVAASVGEVVIINNSSNVTTLSDAKPLPGDPIGMQFYINLKGTYPDLVTFIRDLEDLRVIAKVDSLTITSTKSDTGNVIGVAISGRTPYIGNQ